MEVLLFAISSTAPTTRTLFQYCNARQNTLQRLVMMSSFLCACLSRILPQMCPLSKGQLASCMDAPAGSRYLAMNMDKRTNGHVLVRCNVSLRIACRRTGSMYPTHGHFRDSQTTHDNHFSLRIRALLVLVELLHQPVCLPNPGSLALSIMTTLAHLETTPVPARRAAKQL